MTQHTDLQPPSLPYQMAFDCCAMELAKAARPVLVVASAPFYAREILRRWSGKAILWPRGNWPAGPDRLRETMGPEVLWKQVQLDGSASVSTTALTERAVWSIPEEPGWREVLTVLTQSASVGTKLIVLGQAAHGRRFLPDAPSSPGRPAKLAAITAGLESQHWQVRTVYGFQGPLSLLLGFSSRLPSLAGRLDLADRYYAAVRKHFVVVGRQASWASVWIAIADLEQAI